MITRAHRIRIACVLGLVGCTPSERSAPVRPIAVVRPGTYELRLCRVVCDVKHPQNVIRSGWVVLDSIPTDTRPFADSVRRVLQARLDFVGIDSASANGCFALQNDRPEIHTLGGALGAGLLHWARTARTDSITFALYGSPDAGYEASVAMTESGLAGRGHSWGDDMPEAGYPDDVIAGTYLGPPDPRRCNDAGMAILALMREYRRHRR